MGQPGSAQQEGTLGLMLFTGAQNTPTAFDVFRSVEYDPSIRVGAGVILNIDEWVAVRGSFGYAANSGEETGQLSDAIDFSRQYYAAELQLRYPGRRR